METIFKRVSVRSYLDIDVDEATVEKILRAGMAAPSAKNQRPWEFYVVERPGILQQLGERIPAAAPVARASVAIVACSRKENLPGPQYVEMDMSACMENMLLEAAHLNMGAVWLAVAPSEEKKAIVRELLDLPDRLDAFAILPVGYPMGEPKPHDRFDPERIHRID